MKHWRLLLWPAMATVIALGILLSLGSWQLQRRYEKSAMLDALNLASTATPKALTSAELFDLRVLPPGSNASAKKDLAELTRVTVSGKFIPSRSVPVRATLPSPKNDRSVGGLGFFWMTPLKIENGPIIFINRGFVPVGADYKAPAITTPEDVQIITGLLRQSEKPQTFTPADNPAKGEYFSRDPKVMATSVALRDVADFFIDAERTDLNSLSPPVGVDAKEMIARIPNNHLQYAVTWFGFAVTLLGVFGFFAHGRVKTAKTLDRNNHV